VTALILYAVGVFCRSPSRRPDGQALAESATCFLGGGHEPGSILPKARRRVKMAINVGRGPYSPLVLVRGPKFGMAPGSWCC
jgi:hypothetical protein